MDAPPPKAAALFALVLACSKGSGVLVCADGSPPANGSCGSEEDTGSSDTDLTQDSDSDTDGDTASDSDSGPGQDSATGDSGTNETDDADKDGYTVEDGDCDDGDPAVYPGSSEIDNGVDDDCDKWIDEWEVCATGSDYIKIQDALDDAADGRLIVVCAGTYAEHLDFNGVNADVESADGPLVTTIDGSGSGTVVTFSGGEVSARLSGFTITGGYQDVPGDYYGSAVEVYAASPQLSDIVFTGNDSPRGAAVVVRGGAAPVLDRVQFTYNTAERGAGGLFVMDADITMSGAMFDHNTGTTQYAAGAMAFENDATTTSGSITNCTVVANSGSRVGGVMLYPGKMSLVFDNLIIAYQQAGVGVGTLWSSSGYQPITAVYSDVYGNVDGNFDAYVPAWSDASIVSVDPVFASRSTGDYHLQSTSPLVDAGDPDSALNDTDHTRSDVGAYGGPAPWSL